MLAVYSRNPGSFGLDAGGQPNVSGHQNGPARSYAAAVELEADLRIRNINDRPLRAHAFVLYWMIAARRAAFNYGLDRVVGWSEKTRTAATGS
jgi:hypothetical protein